MNARKEKLTDRDFRRLAEMEEHPEVAKWIFQLMEEIWNKHSLLSRTPLEIFSRHATSFLSLCSMGKLWASLEYID